MRRVIIGDRKAFADITDAHVGRLYLRDGSWHASADVRTKGISGSKREGHRKWPYDEGLSKLKAGREQLGQYLVELVIYIRIDVKLSMPANYIDAALLQGLELTCKREWSDERVIGSRGWTGFNWMRIDWTSRFEENIISRVNKRWQL